MKIMTHLWMKAEDSWHPRPIPDAVTPLGSTDAGVARPVLRRQSAAPERWVLLAPTGTAVRVNGAPIPAGIRTLRDRDSIHLLTQRPMYFSTERLARIEPFPGMGRAIFCARCKTRIAEGRPAVACPRCRAWHHELSDLNCWTHTEQCAVCDQPTALDAGYRWCPEGL